jgi:CubicO group peptidase (beta-lactamase class C family)
LALAVYASAAILIPLTLTANAVFHPDDSAQQFAAYMDTHVPQDALIGTWEQELGFLTNHRYQYPPQSALADAVRRQWFGGERATYDWESTQPAYIAIGPFGDYTAVFNSPKLDKDFLLVQQIGPYKLYQRR